MAGIILKTSPSVVLPLAIRAIGSISTALNGVVSASRPQDGSLLNRSQSFSTATTDKDSVNESIYELRRHEYNKFTHNYSQVNTLPDSFPYKIIENEDKWQYPRTLVLERKGILDDDDETIILKIDMSDVDTKDIESSYKTNGDDDTCEDYYTIPMIVEIEKPSTNDHLHLKITATTRDIIIQSFYITSKDKHIACPENNPRLEGPIFKELDVELQKSLYKYLEMRGIKSNIVSYLLKYIAVEINKNYCEALNGLDEFVRTPPLEIS